MNEQFNNFNDVKHTPLKVYNRVVTANNIRSDFGEVAAREYLSQFSEGEKKAMYFMQLYINKNGIEAAKKAATKTFSPEAYDGYVN